MNEIEMERWCDRVLTAQVLRDDHVLGQGSSEVEVINDA